VCARHSPVRVRGALAIAAFAALPVGSSGCGRRATEADCQLIVNKSFELEVQESTGSDMPTIRKREAEVRPELDEKIAACESRRVTEKTMACVRAAATVGEMDKCLR
jgi:hypothetical protein